MFQLHLSSELQCPVGAVSSYAEPMPGSGPMLGLCRLICISKGATSTLLYKVQTAGPRSQTETRKGISALPQVSLAASFSPDLKHSLQTRPT